MALFSSTVSSILLSALWCALGVPLLSINQGAQSFDTVQNTLPNTQKVSIKDYSWLRKMAQGRGELGLVHDDVEECL